MKYLPELFKHDGGSWSLGISRHTAPNQFSIHLFYWSFIWCFGDGGTTVIEGHGG